MVRCWDVDSTLCFILNNKLLIFSCLKYFHFIFDPVSTERVGGSWSAAGSDLRLDVLSVSEWLQSLNVTNRHI